MRCEEAMHKYSTGELPFEELMDMKAELIREEKITCEHPICGQYMSRGVLLCCDCGEEIPSIFSPDGDGRED